MEPYALNTTRGALHPGGGVAVSGKLGRPRGTVLSTLKRRHAEAAAAGDTTTPELLLHVGDLAYATGYAGGDKAAWAGLSEGCVPYFAD